MTVYFTGWRCGCTLLSEDYPHPPQCPHHAPGVTIWDYSTLAAQTERLGPTEAVTVKPGIPLGLEIKAIESYEAAS